jgi:hypothetical protein
LQQHRQSRHEQRGPQQHPFLQQGHPAFCLDVFLAFFIVYFLKSVKIRLSFNYAN